ncbi:acyltransferase family protein [Thiocystis minor]|uniref:acyltransferase family protein n=1 Tax=Thiocystis minor TaxID=61597 RepID=UPI001911C962|nr:acyltransferase [Thiocystis minor]
MPTAPWRAACRPMVTARPPRGFAKFYAPRLFDYYFSSNFVDTAMNSSCELNHDYKKRLLTKVDGSHIDSQSVKDNQVNAKMGGDKLYTIQILRGVAAILVVLFHATMLCSSKFNLAPFNRFFLFGFSGVHIFFVLSGFIIVTIHYHDIGRPSKLISYLKKRFSRIYPNYWLVLTLISLWYLFVINIMPIHITPTLIYQNLNLFFPPPKFINPVSWTLSMEVFFYFIFSILILNRKLGVLALSLWLIGVLLTQFFSIKIPVIPRYVFSKYVILFWIGMLTAYMLIHMRNIETVRREWFAWSLGTLGLILFSATALAVWGGGIINFTHWIPLFGFGLAGALLIFFTLSNRAESFIQNRKILTSLGDASYSIYLIHYPLLLGLIFILRKHVTVDNGFSIAIFFVVISVIAVISGWLFHLFLERPLLKFVRGVLFLRAR